MKKAWGAAFLVVALVVPGQAQEAGTEKGFTPLFDSKTLDGWQIMNNGKFSVKDGVIFLDRGSGWLRTDKEYKDYVLRMDFRFVSKGADSGIFIHATKEGKNWPAKNYQVQTMDNDTIANVFTAGNLPRPKVKRDTAKVKDVRKKTGEWQTYEFTVQGSHLEIKLNGVLVTVAEDLSAEPGYIGLQGEGGQLEFKNIRLKELK